MKKLIGFGYGVVGFNASLAGYFLGTDQYGGAAWHTFLFIFVLFSMDQMKKRCAPTR